MGRPRIALASGFAAAMGAGFLLAGRLPGSALVACVLVLTARAAVPVVAGDARALARLGALVPAWVGVLIVGLVRANSPDLADVRGVSAVAGLPLSHGTPLVVAGVWLALAAGTLALLVPSAATGPQAGVLIDSPFRRFDAAAAGLQVALLVTLFSGPQIRSGIDVVPWVAAAMGIGAAAWVLRSLAQWEWLPRAAGVLAGAAVAAVLVGGPL